MKKGFSLVELIIVLVLFVILAAAVTYVLRAVLLIWSSQEERSGISIGLDRGMEVMARDLREATTISSVNNDEIRFTPDGSNYYIYYLYNSSESYPPSFSESSYELRRADLTGGIGGTFTYGSGRLVIFDVVPPTTSDMSISGNMITIDLTVSRDDETMRARTEIRPRNL